MFFETKVSSSLVRAMSQFPSIAHHDCATCCFFQTFQVSVLGGRKLNLEEVGSSPQLICVTLSKSFLLSRSQLHLQNEESG